jgi:hypothetical protein
MNPKDKKCSCWVTLRQIQSKNTRADKMNKWKLQQRYIGPKDTRWVILFQHCNKNRLDTADNFAKMKTDSLKRRSLHCKGCKKPNFYRQKKFLVGKAGTQLRT